MTVATSALTGRPLLDSANDMGWFVDRGLEQEALSSALGSGFNTLLVGAPGSGKTTLMRGWMRQVRAEGTSTDLVYVRASTARDAAGLLWLAWCALSAEDPESLPAKDGTQQLLSRLEAQASGQCVLLDDGSPEVLYQVFGRLRDEVWALDLSWVVGVNSDQEGAVTTPPADAFFERTVHLRPFGAHDARRLLERRVGAQAAAAMPDAVDGWTPREILTAARQVADLEDSAAWRGQVASRAEQQTKASGLGRAPAMLFAEVQSLAPVSTSDDRLLDRMGWTPQRASQVMRQLAKAGLVVSEDARSTGPGRPAKLYRVAPVDQHGAGS